LDPYILHSTLAYETMKEVRERTMIC